MHLKIIVEKKTSKVLGFHMFGEHAAEIIQMASVSLKIGVTKNDLDQPKNLQGQTF